MSASIARAIAVAVAARSPSPLGTNSLVQASVLAPCDSVGVGTSSIKKSAWPQNFASDNANLFGVRPKALSDCLFGFGKGVRHLGVQQIFTVYETGSSSGAAR